MELEDTHHFLRDWLSQQTAERAKVCRVLRALADELVAARLGIQAGVDASSIDRALLGAYLAGAHLLDSLSMPALEHLGPCAAFLWIVEKWRIARPSALLDLRSDPSVDQATTAQAAPILRLLDCSLDIASQQASPRISMRVTMSAGADLQLLICDHLLRVPDCRSPADERALELRIWEVHSLGGKVTRSQAPQVASVISVSMPSTGVQSA